MDTECQLRSTAARSRRHRSLSEAEARNGVAALQEWRPRQAPTRGSATGKKPAYRRLCKSQRNPRRMTLPRERRWQATPHTAGSVPKTQEGAEKRCKTALRPRATTYAEAAFGRRRLQK